MARVPVEAAASGSSEASSSATELCSRSTAGKKCPVDHDRAICCILVQTSQHSKLAMRRCQDGAIERLCVETTLCVACKEREAKRTQGLGRASAKAGRRMGRTKWCHRTQSEDAAVRAREPDQQPLPANACRLEQSVITSSNPGRQATRCGEASQVDSNDRAKRSPELPGAEGKCGRLSPFGGADAERPLRAQAQVEALLLRGGSEYIGRRQRTGRSGYPCKPAQRVQQRWLRTGWLRLRTLYRRHVLSDVSTAKCRLLDGCHVVCDCITTS